MSTSFILSLSRLWQEQLAPRYQQLAPREQLIIKLAAVLLPLMVLVFGLYLPVQDRLHALNRQVAKLHSDVLEAQALADRLKQGGGRPAGQENALAVVERIAGSTGVRQSITRIKPQPSMGGGQSLMVHFATVPYQDAVRFIGELDANGLTVTRAKMRGEDPPGVINLELTVAP